MIERIELQNTHNRGYNDRGTRDFEIWASNEVDGSNELVNPVLILDGTLADRSGAGSDIPFDVFSTDQGDFGGFHARYLQFTAANYWGVSSGLNEIRVFAAVPEPGTLALLAIGLAGLAIAVWRRRRAK